MADIVASILGIASFGISLTRTLYDFGATAAAAKDQTDYVARNISFYSNVLGLLADTLDEEEPIHSKRALNLVNELYDQSHDLFDRVKRLLPDRKKITDQPSFIQKILWSFKRSKVECLVRELEYLKSTVDLLLHVLTLGKKLRSRRYPDSSIQGLAANSFVRRGTKAAKRSEAMIQVQMLRAQNSIVENIAAKARFETQQALSNREEGRNKSSALVKIESGTLCRITNTAEAAKSPTEQRALVLSYSGQWLENLVADWTNISELPLADREGGKTSDTEFLPPQEPSLPEKPSLLPQPSLPRKPSPAGVLRRHKDKKEDAHGWSRSADDSCQPHGKLFGDVRSDDHYDTLAVKDKNDNPQGRSRIADDDRRLRGKLFGEVETDRHYDTSKYTRRYVYEAPKAPEALGLAGTTGAPHADSSSRDRHAAAAPIRISDIREPFLDDEYDSDSSIAGQHDSTQPTVWHDGYSNPAKTRSSTKHQIVEPVIYDYSSYQLVLFPS